MVEMKNNRSLLSSLIARWNVISGISFLGYSVYLFYYSINIRSMAMLVLPCLVLGAGIGLLLRMKSAILVSKIFLCGLAILLALGMVNPFVLSESKNLFRFYLCSGIAILACGALLGLVIKGQRQGVSR